MATRPDNAPLVVIVGPTASGKTAAAIELAEQLGGEIICADSRTIYKGLDIGTAKPTAEEQARVVHHGLDLVEPGERFTAADFQAYTQQTISDIRSRGHVPILVGGTGLYVDAVIFDYEFDGEVYNELRAKLQAMTVNELKNHCIENNIHLPRNENNPRHLISAIEHADRPPKRRLTPQEGTIIVGITTDKTELRRRITARAQELFARGVIEEATRSAETYGWDNEAMTGNVYRLVRRYTLGELSYDEMVQAFITSDWQLAKRQTTWFKRNEFIQWMSREHVVRYVVAEIETA